MTNTTRLGRYKRGIELEADGLTGEEVARQLGFKDRQGWYDTKYYYAKRSNAFNERAREGKQDKAKTPDYLEAAKVEKVTVPVKAQIEIPQEAPVTIDETTQHITLNKDVTIPATPAADPPKTTKVSVTVSAEGEAMRYRLEDDLLSVSRIKNKQKALCMTLPEFYRMVEEVRELIRP